MAFHRAQNLAILGCLSSWWSAFCEFFLCVVFWTHRLTKRSIQMMTRFVWFLSDLWGVWWIWISLHAILKVFSQVQDTFSAISGTFFWRTFPDTASHERKTFHHAFLTFQHASTINYRSIMLAAIISPFLQSCNKKRRMKISPIEMVTELPVHYRYQSSSNWKTIKTNKHSVLCCESKQTLLRRTPVGERTSVRNLRPARPTGWHANQPCLSALPWFYPVCWWDSPGVEQTQGTRSNLSCHVKFGTNRANDVSSHRRQKRPTLARSSRRRMRPSTIDFPQMVQLVRLENIGAFFRSDWLAGWLAGFHPLFSERLLPGLPW